jgi:UDP-N-acetylmuramate dehydrogenase
MTIDLVQKNVSLKNKNTLRLDVSARYFASINTVPELQQVLASRIAKSNKILVLGGGSNILFSRDFDGLVLKVNIKGIEIVYQDNNSVHLKVAAGEDWPGLVKYVVSKGWGGIENLAMVPGTAGAAPLQNIASYGHNLHETLLSVDAITISTTTPVTLLTKECRLGYRTSIFKTDVKDQYVIVAIVLKLQKKPALNTGYKSRYESLADELSKIASPPHDIRDVYQAVINIRQKKLPDVNSVGTVGSVFKNPLITREQLKEVTKICPGIHYYPEDKATYPLLMTMSEQPLKRSKYQPHGLLMLWAGLEKQLETAAYGKTSH